ncbi:unnamed protein product [Notodromas monacha]|uniref:Cytochrome b5 n=1 Tax=Notodromas monacha TaxID=399045 RepID=A0A7R9BNL9_9CRUS|nr:unnamed protein product [Notodromas monacha]CAG0918839.1 unnamed protein product [Notodromas monacha]
MASTSEQSESKTLKTFTLAEVAGKNKEEACLIVIHDKVYDVKSFLDEHPGGEEVLLEQAGKVATEAFEDVGHSTDARDLMKTYLVGEITEEEKQRTKEKLLKWTKDPVPESGWKQWLLPMAVAIVGSLLFRLYASRHEAN